MLKAGESSNFLMDNSSDGLEQFGFDEDGEYGSMSIDLDTLYDIIDEKGDNDSTEPLQTCSEDSLKSASPGEAVLGAPNNPENTGLETDLMGPGAVHSWYNSGVSNCKIGLSSCSFGSTLYNDLSGNNRVQGSPVNTNSASIKDFISLVPGNGACFTERAGFTLPTSSTTSSFAQRDADNIPDFGKNFDVNTSQGETETQFMNTVVEINPQCAFPYPGPKNIGVNLCKYGTSGENIETVESPENILHDLYSQDITSNESSICLSNDIMSGYPALQYERGIDDQLFRSCNSQILTTNEELKNHVKDKEFPTESACSSTKMKLNGHLGRIEKYETGVLMNNYLDVEGWNYHYEVEANDYISPMESSFFDANGYHIDEKVPTQPFSSSQSYMYSEERVKDERPQEMLVTSRSIWPPVNVLDEAVSREQSFSADTKMFSKDPKSSFSASSRSLSTQKTEKLMDSKEDMVFASKKLCHPHNFMSSTSSVHTGNLSLNAQGQYMPFVPSFPISNNQSYNVVSQVSKVSPESSHSNFSEKSIVEDDSDICIIEDISHPAPISAPLNRSVAFKNTVVSSHYSTSSDNHVGVGGRVKAKDERVILRLLQDLSQPKSEISPPDGSLAVPLLRHQRIALSWMVQKETDNTHCSGGILADDQGLGKTVSTIALILKEKPPSLCHVKQDEVEPLNLDEDDEVLRGVKQESNALFCMSNETPMRSMKPLVLAKGRPAAGTLIVCPTSVLRQWDDELRNKVTSKASLSVLVYHGSNRTKDPSELAKYDVVLTTYSIVSMEVPKQPRVDEDDEEKGKPKDLVGQKRKNPPGSDKRRSDKKGSDNALLESVARPLAKVGWFRVVLDEAQSIKNHRTQVARACWGLRAKRRWCLSGTPIQNAIDDLYSYFRFLKYDPYDAYKLFCSYIKNPISKNPTNGYKKLQTVLKTIMLRRTKGTLLDGEPIINLPPKRVELKKVEFSKEERDFYSRLEADSRAQFEEYANAGTVKQNYVNILLMLLRLRQACDHPFLVKGVDSHSLWNSSVEMARKLPREEQENLLKCLEVSLAICRICNDPPEDAVVAKCGHVFCNQCLSEQLSGDDPGCPVTNCKARLNASSVFSKATLDSCLRDQSCEDNLAGCSRQEVVETGESCNDGHLYNSSKIKAALDVLKSLCGQQDSSPQNGSALDSSPQNGSALDSSAQIGSALDSSPQIGFALDSSPHNGSVQSTIDGNASSVENSIDTCAVELPKDIHDSQSSDADKGCSTAIKVAGQKAIVFSQWTRMLDLLEACLKDSSIKYRRLDGTMSVTARDKAVKDFNTMPEVTVMIMSLKAASLGLNMVAACHVLLLDLWWNPTTEDQAIDRAHRIGQTRPVTVLRLTVRDTVEDRILALQQKKREMVASAFGEDENGGRQSRLTVEDLKYLFMM